MKLMRGKYDKLITIMFLIGSVFVITHVNKWHEPFMYTMAIAFTLYSYLIAVGLLCSFTIYSIWSVVHNIRTATKLKVENLEMIKSLTATMNEISQGKPCSLISVKH